jgi:isoleucyl-tRNA synthetase
MDSLSVGIDADLNDDLVLEGRVLDLIHEVNTMRKEAGLELTDRITLTLPQSQKDLLEHEQWIKDEVLATEIRTDAVAAPELQKGSDPGGV